MTTVSFNPAGDCYFAFNVSTEDAINLSKLQWRPHPDAPMTTWWTRSPYLAAPLWNRVAKDDAATRQALGWYAWNYETSYSAAPLVGTGVDTIRIPVGQKPFPFQVAGVQRAVLRKKILIGDQPGLGKSCESLVTANMVRPQRLLIGCPTVLVENWAIEAERWLVDPCSITILNNPRKAVPDRGVLILPYSRGHTFVEKILAGPKLDMIIADEAHFLKSSTAQRAVPWFAPGGLVDRAERALLLTGTPVPNNPLEIYPALRSLAPESIGGISRDRFKELYCSTFNGTAKVAKKNGGVAEVAFESNTAKDEPVLNAELRASGVMVRRMKDDVLTQLPPKRVSLVHLSPTAEIEALVREEADLYDMLETKLLSSKELFALQGHIANVRQRLGVLKAPKIADYIKTIFDSGETHVVSFMLHREAMDLVRKAFEHTRVKVRMMTGSESVASRQASVVAFQKNEGYELIVAQVAAAGVGFTLTAANRVVLGEIAWTPATNDQCIDRCHRIGARGVIQADIISFPHACEEKVIRTNARKAISAYNILDKNLMQLFPQAA